MNHGKLSILLIAKVMVATLLLLTSCTSSQEEKKEVLPADQFGEILLEIHLAEAKAMDQAFQQDSSQITLKGDYLFIFEEHGIDPEIFFESFDYYSDHPKQLADIYAEIHARLSVMQDSLIHR